MLIIKFYLSTFFYGTAILNDNQSKNNVQLSTIVFI